MASQKTPSRPSATDMKKTAARFGIAAFMFFFIKGLLWLIVPAMLLAQTCDPLPYGATP